MSKDILFYYLDKLKVKIRKVNKNEYVLEDDIRMKILKDILIFNKKDIVKMRNFVDGIKELYEKKKLLNRWKNSGRVKRKFGAIKKKIMYAGKEKVINKTIKKEVKWCSNKKEIKELRKLI